MRARRIIGPRPRPLPPRLTEEEERAHAAFVAGLGERAALAALSSGGDGRPRRPQTSARLRWPLLLRRLRDAPAIERGEIHRVDQQRREAALPRRVGDDLPGEREEQPRALDQEQRVHVLLRHVADLEDAGIGDLDDEQRLVAARRLGVELQLDLEIGLRLRPRVDVDVDVEAAALRPPAAASIGAPGFSKEMSFTYWPST